MYYVIFYGCIILSIAAFIYSIIFYIKNDIKGCIKDIRRLVVFVFIIAAVEHGIVNNNVKEIPAKLKTYTGNEINEGKIVEENEAKASGSGEDTESTGDGNTETVRSEENETAGGEEMGGSGNENTEDDSPVIIVSTVDDSRSKCIVDDTEGENDCELCWANEDVELKVEISCKNEVETISYIVGQKEVVVSEYKEGGIIIPVSGDEQKEDGIPVEITAKDIAGNTATHSCRVYIDKESPVMGDYSYFKEEDKIKKHQGCIFSNKVVVISIPVSDTRSGVDEKSVKAVFLRNGDTNTSVELVVNRDLKGCLYTCIPLDSENNYCDGFVEFTINDKAGNTVKKKSDRIIYNRNKPLINWDYKNAYGKWTNEDEVINLKVKAGDCGIKKISVFAAGEKIKDETPDTIMSEYECILCIDKSSKKYTGYVVEIRVTDNCGNESRKKTRLFIDKEYPALELSGVDEHAYYRDDVKPYINVSDVSYKDTKVYYYVKRLEKDRMSDNEFELPFPKDYNEKYELHFTREGEYEIYAKAIDGAGNEVVTEKVCFVIDKTAPEIAFYGVKDGSISKKNVKLGVLCEEDFYAGVDAGIIVKRSLAGKTYTNEPAIFEHDKRIEKRELIMSDEGEYEVVLSAKDNAGNEAVEEIIHFTVDKTAPDINISGINQYGVYDGSVKPEIKIHEEFFEDSKVLLKAVKSDMYGIEKEVDLPGVVQDKKNTVLNLDFNEDGLYRINVMAKDAAGNKSKKTYRFLIDSTAPEIYGVEQYDGKYYKTFMPGKESFIDVRDLTLKDYKLLLNGIEYDGKSEITGEGKYVLSAKATDELGHVSGTSAQFIIDKTIPEIEFYGVMDGEVVEKEGVVRWELINSDDTIEKIIINGEECDANLRKLMYNTYGSYDIVINSIDKAGNRGVSEIHFQYVQAKMMKKVMSGTVFKNNSETHHKTNSIIAVILVVTGIIILTAVKCFERFKNT